MYTFLPQKILLNSRVQASSTFVDKGRISAKNTELCPYVGVDN